ncbi:uncharacterized protein PHACADRAFT_182761 [Phanerochaete carnosa HHB-10118-sp]|uniref:Uncharacterized protein n=1 Tax=Phanerochaete carnosa (strain HHB-10118-sp) TaxID=650164 RepID=K5W3J3_PHACS|nr:uncharacterized protein PHACADRAFT_182761 [Phanerochaete carnosa HHB-10118-sp]EKM58433.1 hypothetical protein PHACADRAFT_182761 [Phanerochaete carnosa HHB-10118-sp]
MPSTTTPPSAALQASKTGLLKRIVTKLRPPQPATSLGAAVSVGKASGSGSKMKWWGMVLLPPAPRHKAPVPTLPNAFLLPGQREAALRSRGLVPRRYRDANGDTLPMSVQKADHDRRFAALHDDDDDASEGETKARRICEQWLARNADADCDVDSLDLALDSADVPRPASPVTSLISQVRWSPGAASSRLEGHDDVHVEKAGTEGEQTTPLLTGTPSLLPTSFDVRHSQRDATFLAPPSTSIRAQIATQRGRSLATVSTAASIPALSPTRTTSSVSTSDTPNTPRPTDETFGTFGRVKSSSVTSGESWSFNHRDVPKVKTSGGKAAECDVRGDFRGPHPRRR